MFNSILAATVPMVSIEVSQDPINIGDTVDIHCTCTGTRSPRYHWARPNHASLPTNAQEYGNILRLTNVAVSDSGPYRCIVDTPEGIFEKDFNLIVHGNYQKIYKFMQQIKMINICKSVHIEEY